MTVILSWPQYVNNPLHGTASAFIVSMLIILPITWIMPRYGFSPGDGFLPCPASMCESDYLNHEIHCWTSATKVATGINPAAAVPLVSATPEELQLQGWLKFQKIWWVFFWMFSGSQRPRKSKLLIAIQQRDHKAPQEQGIYSWNCTVITWILNRVMIQWINIYRLQIWHPYLARLDYYPADSP